MATFDFNDDSVVVVIGSGAGGGTLANELCQKGIKVVVLEAGARQSPATFINDEWKSFMQLAWLDPRTTSGTWRVAKDFPGCRRGSARPSVAPPRTGPAPRCASRSTSSRRAPPTATSRARTCSTGR